MSGYFSGDMISYDMYLLLALVSMPTPIHENYISRQKPPQDLACCAHIYMHF